MGFVPNFGGIDLMGQYFKSQAQKIRRKRKRSTRRRKVTGYAGTKRRKYGTRKAYGYARTTRRGTSTMRALKSQVRTLSKKTNESLSQLTYRTIYTGSISSSVNEQASNYYALCSNSQLEAAMSKAKFYDPSNPGTLITGNLATGGYSRKIRFKSCHARLDLRSSFQVPMEVRVYSCTVSDDTNFDPQTAWSNSVGDSSNIASIDVPYTYPSDSVARSIWKYKLVKKAELRPGQHCTVSVSEREFTYDPSVYDNHNLAYQTHYGRGHTILVVVNAVLGHDTTLSQQTLLQGAVDVSIRRRFVISYNSGGPPVHWLEHENNMSTAFTNSGVTGGLVTDNQAYSQA